MEVTHATSVQKEAWNIEKLLRAGVSTVVAVSDSKKHLENIRATAEGANLEMFDKHVQFTGSPERGDCFNELDSTFASHETRARGYQVSVSCAKLSEEGPQARKEPIDRAVAEAIRQITPPEAKDADSQ